MNNVVLVGRLTRDPELRRTGEGLAIARFSLAIDRPVRSNNGEKQADFPNIVVFGKVAENCEKYLSKGRLAAVQGRIQTGSYTNKDGNKVYTTEVVAERVQFLEWGDKPNQGSQFNNFDNSSNFQNNYSSNNSSPASSAPQGFDAVEDDDSSVPF